MNSLTSAVAAVITDPAGRLLLCEQSQGHHRWGLPGGKIRSGESPMHAAIRDIREQIGADVHLLEVVGLYELTSDNADDLPDVLVHVFRARLDGEVTLNAPGRICRLSWHDSGALPTAMTATTRAAVTDATAGRAGVLRTVRRDAEPEIPEAQEPTPAEASPVEAELIDA
jgi:8-oxo-dGTP diphosphatase